MSENTDIWEFDNLSVNDDMMVDGQVYTKQKPNGAYVRATVSSYEYKRDGETKSNHVPVVYVTDERGRIKHMAEAGDSSNPHKAVGEAKSTAEYIFNNINEYL